MLRVDAVGLCGTDHHIWAGAYRASRLPLVQGHEVAATVLQAPPGRDDLVRGTGVAVDPTWACGRCAACRKGATNVCSHMSVLGVHRDGALCDRLLVDAAAVHPTGDLSSAEATLVEPASVAMHAVRLAEASEGRAATGNSSGRRRAVVYGAGTIGVFVVAGLVAAGATVACVEPRPERRTLASAAGAEMVLSPDEGPSAVVAWAGADGPAAVVEASGTPAAFEAAIEVVAHAGTVVAAGISDATASVNMAAIPYKGLTLRGSRNSLGVFSDAVAFVRSHRGIAQRLITHRFPLDEVRQAFLLLDGWTGDDSDGGSPAGVAKVVVEM